MTESVHLFIQLLFLFIELVMEETAISEIN